MNSVLLVQLGFGFLGALCRILASFAVVSRSRQRLAFSGVVLYSVLALVTGAFSGVVFDGGVALSFLAGYVGMDFLNTYAKSLKGKKIT